MAANDRAALFQIASALVAAGPAGEDLLYRETKLNQAAAVGIPAAVAVRHELMVERLAQHTYLSNRSLWMAGWCRLIAAAMRGDPVQPTDAKTWARELYRELAGFDVLNPPPSLLMPFSGAQLYQIMADWTHLLDTATQFWDEIAA